MANNRYRALIIDNEPTSSLLRNYLLRPSNRQFSIYDVQIVTRLSEALNMIADSDFIFIDPFVVGVAEAYHFINEAQSRVLFKPVALWRMNSLWYKNQRDQEAQVIQLIDQRRMLSLNKEDVNAPNFSDIINHAVISLEGELQRQTQRNDHWNTSGQTDLQGYNVSNIQPVMPQHSFSVAQWRDLKILVEDFTQNYLNSQPRQTATPTTPFGYATPDLNSLNLLVTVPNLQAAVDQLKKDVVSTRDTSGKAQGTADKAQETAQNTASQQVDLSKRFDLMDRRIGVVESQQGRGDPAVTTLKAQIQTLQIFLAGFGVVIGLLLIAVLFMLFTRH